MKRVAQHGPHAGGDDRRGDALPHHVGDRHLHLVADEEVVGRSPAAAQRDDQLVGQPEPAPQPRTTTRSAVVADPMVDVIRVRVTARAGSAALRRNVRRVLGLARMFLGPTV
jgi:hypothetical protein